MYYSDQFRKKFGRTADKVLKIGGGCPYDVGLVKNAEGSEYEVVLDGFGNHIGRKIGTPEMRAGGGRQGLDGNEAHIGMFTQHYTKHLMIETAEAQGHSVDDCTVDDQGEIHLTLAVAG